MADSGTATITATAGPGLTITAGVFTEITDFDIQIANRTLQFTSQGKIFIVALTGSNTFTITASAGVYSLTVA